MATRYFRTTSGATTFDLTSMSNWSATADGATGASVPTTGDQVFFLEGDGVISSNLNGLSAVDLNSVYVGPNCRLSTSGEMVLQVSNGSGPNFTYSGRGSRFSVSSTGGGAGIDAINVQHDSGTLYLGTIATLPVLTLKGSSGQVELSGDCDPTVFANYGMTARIEPGAAITTARILGGMTQLKRNVATAFVSGRSTMLLTDRAVSITTKLWVYDGIVVCRGTGTWAEVEMFGGGTVTPAGGIINGTTITALVLRGTQRNVKFFQSVSGGKGGSFVVSGKTLDGDLDALIDDGSSASTLSFSFAP